MRTAAEFMGTATEMMETFAEKTSVTAFAVAFDEVAVS